MESLHPRYASFLPWLAADASSDALQLTWHPPSETPWNTSRTTIAVHGVTGQSTRMESSRLIAARRSSRHLRLHHGHLRKKWRIQCGLTSFNSRLDILFTKIYYANLIIAISNNISYTR